MNTKVVPNPEQKGWEENGATTDGTPIYKWESGGVSGNGSGTGAGMVISPTPPTDKVTGMQWLNSTTAEVFIWDEDKWVEMPAGSGGDLWTDNGGNSISYDGNVGINANSETPLTIGKAGTTALWEWDLQAGAVDSIRLSAKNPSGGYYAQDALVVDSGGTVTVNGDLLAAKSDAGADALAVGYRAGLTNQGASATAVGYVAGYENQSEHATALGRGAGYSGQGDFATAIGRDAAVYNQGSYSVAIGYSAGYQDQAANGIIINSSGMAINSTNAHAITIQSGSSRFLHYNGSDAWTFAGGPVNGLNGFRQNGAPVIDAKGLISTLATLRNATKDETQDIRESLRSAIDELVAEFEQEIAAMPAGGPQ
jgi:hypothetical protein